VEEQDGEGFGAVSLEVEEVFGVVSLEEAQGSGVVSLEGEEGLWAVSLGEAETWEIRKRLGCIGQALPLKVPRHDRRRWWSGLRSQCVVH
jgi:hypothetical protein